MTLKSKPSAKQTPAAALISVPAIKLVAAIPSFDILADSAFIRESQHLQIQEDALQGSGQECRPAQYAVCLE